MYRKDVFYSGSIANLAITEHHGGNEEDEYIDEPVVKLIERGASSRRLSRQLSYMSSTPQLMEYRHSVISSHPHLMSFTRNSSAAAFSIPRGSIVASHLSIPMSSRKASLAEGIEIESEGMQTIIQVLKEMINVTLLANPYFLLIALSNAFGMLGFYVPFVYLPGIAQTKGVQLGQANFLISIIGISNTGNCSKILARMRHYYDYNINNICVQMPAIATKLNIDAIFTFSWSCCRWMVFRFSVGESTVCDECGHFSKWSMHHDNAAMP
jgi:hypothetical protein